MKPETKLNTKELSGMMGSMYITDAQRRNIRKVLNQIDYMTIRDKYYNCHLEKEEFDDEENVGDLPDKNEEELCNQWCDDLEHCVSSIDEVTDRWLKGEEI